jgi:uncharacterized protein (DUF433 family)
MDEEALIAKYIEPNPHRPGRDEVRLREYGVPVWSLVGYLEGYDWDIDRIAKAFKVPREAVDARIDANVIEVT